MTPYEPFLGVPDATVTRTICIECIPQVGTALKFRFQSQRHQRIDRDSPCSRR
jgi:hypothetical protein